MGLVLIFLSYVLSLYQSVWTTRDPLCEGRPRQESERGDMGLNRGMLSAKNASGWHMALAKPVKVTKLGHGTTFVYQIYNHYTDRHGKLGNHFYRATEIWKWMGR